MGAMPHDLDGAPPWAQLIYDELVRLRQAQQPQSMAVTTAEAAQILGISATTLRRQYAEGKLPQNIGKGSHLRFERVAIERMATAQRKGRPRKVT